MSAVSTSTATQPAAVVPQSARATAGRSSAPVRSSAASDGRVRAA